MRRGKGPTGDITGAAGSLSRRDWQILALLVVCGTLFYVVPWPPIFALALLAVVGLAWVRLDLALMLVPLFVPFFMHPKHLGLDLALGARHLGLKELAPHEVFLLVDVCVAAVLVALRRNSDLFDWRAVVWTPFLLPGLLLFFAGTLSTLAAVERHQALEWYRWTLLEPAAFFVLLVAVLRRPCSWFLSFGALLGAAAAAGCVALADLTKGHDLTLIRQRARAHEPYGSADNLGLLYDRAIPVWFALALVAPRRMRCWPLGVLLVPVLVLTYSRGAWLAVVVGCLLVLVVAVPWGRWLALGVLVLAVLVSAVAGASAVSALRAGHAHTVEQRFRVWQSSITMIRDHPVLGVGPDNFIHYYAPRHQLYIPCPPGLGYMQPAAWTEPCLSHPHNEVLDFWLTTGALGLVAFIWLELVFWRTALRVWRSALPDGLRALLLGSMGAMAAALVHGLVDQAYFLPDLAIIFWLLCAFVSTVDRHVGHDTAWRS